MTQLNQGRFTIANVTTNTFQLTSQVTGANVNGSGFGSYTSGGKAERVHTVVTPYPSADLAELKYAQSGDILTLVHPSHDPRELSRTDHTVWSLVAPTFEPKITFPTGLGATASNGGS